MGLRQPARLSTSPGYGLPSESTAPARGAPSALLPLLLLFVALAAATVWFVAVPALAKPAQAQQACEVIVPDSSTITARVGHDEVREGSDAREADAARPGLARQALSPKAGRTAHHGERLPTDRPRRSSRSGGERLAPADESDHMSMLLKRWRHWVSPAARRGREVTAAWAASHPQTPAASGKK
jgi:hypothetical protein